MSSKKYDVEQLQPQHEDCPFITKEACSSRTRPFRWVIGVFFGVLSVFLALVIYASGQASAANDKYTTMIETVSTMNTSTAKRISSVEAASSKRINTVETTIETHKAMQKASDKAIIEKLDEVKVELSEQRKEQRVLLERILDLQLEVARKQKAD